MPLITEESLRLVDPQAGCRSTLHAAAHGGAPEALFECRNTGLVDRLAGTGRV
jgi:hypothetical protein